MVGLTGSSPSATSRQRRGDDHEDECSIGKEEPNVDRGHCFIHTFTSSHTSWLEGPGLAGGESWGLTRPNSASQPGSTIYRLTGFQLLAATGFSGCELSLLLLFVLLLLLLLSSCRHWCTMCFLVYFGGWLERIIIKQKFRFDSNPSLPLRCCLAVRGPIILWGIVAMRDYQAVRRCQSCTTFGAIG